MSELKAHIAKVATGKPLSFDEARSAFDTIMSGEATPSQIGAFLMALRVRGETVEEISGAVATMREKMLRVEAPDGAIDIVGTGGDGSHSVNISTASAFVIAGAGVPVAKHGNRGLSSQTGAADVLTALGVKIDMPPEAIGRCDPRGRRRLHVRAGASSGDAPCRADARSRSARARSSTCSGRCPTRPASSGRWSACSRPNGSSRWPQTLKALGAEQAWVVHGDGFDEITTTGETQVVGTCRRRGAGPLRSRRRIDRAAAATGARICAAATRPSTRARCATCSKARPAPIATPC